MSTSISAAVIIMVVALVFAIFRFEYKKNMFFTRFRIIFLGTFIASFVLFMPVYLKVFADYDQGILIAHLSSIQHAFRLFALDGEYLGFVEEIENQFPTNSADAAITNLYITIMTCLYFFAPILTFTFLLLFFKNIIAYIRYKSVFIFKQTHVFSELNEKSIALAKSIKNHEIEEETNGKFLVFLKKHIKIFRKNVIVFADVSNAEDERNTDLVEEAMTLGAILFYKDIESIPIKSIFFNRKVKIYLISEDENEKAKQTSHIMKTCDKTGIELYVFSSSTQSQLTLQYKNVTNMKVIRVNDIRTLIYHNLDTYGMRLFNNAIKTQNGERTISAVIVGYGRYGKEMMKALAWFCQYPGFNLVIDIFDTDKKIDNHFKFTFPGMAKRNNSYVLGEDNYIINLHPEIDINSPKFEEEFNKISRPTYIFVCLGTDENNINSAMTIRTLCSKRGLSIEDVDIETVVYDSHSAELISSVWNKDPSPVPIFENEEVANKFYNAENYDCAPFGKKTEKEEDNKDYGLHIIGDLDNFYSCETIVNSKWEREGMLVNRRYFYQSKRVAELIKEDDERKKKQNNKNCEQKSESYENSSKDTQITEQDKFEADEKADKSFWQNEYNYRSSVTKAIHERLKLKLHQFTDYGKHIDALCSKAPIITEKWTEKDIFKYSELEHPRWCAYMRSEGYTRPTDGEKKRDALKKVHPDLVPTEELDKYTKYFDL